MVSHCLDENYTSLLELEQSTHPIFQSFFSNKEHYTLYQKYLDNPTKENSEALDMAFRLFLYEIRLFKYTSTLIRNYTIDVVKRYRRHYKINLYIIDHNSSLKNNLLDLLQHDNSFPVPLLLDDKSDPFTIYQHVTNDDLKNALKSLTKKQISIIELIYMHEMNNKSIANLFNISEQSVSATHKRALNNIERIMR